MNIFVLLNFLVVTVLIYLFVKDRRKKSSNTTFNINRKGKPLDFTTHFFKGREKQLNVLFNFNGETWDAYEILGVPAGSSFNEVETAYKTHTEKSEIIDAAFEAIKKNIK